MADWVQRLWDKVYVSPDCWEWFGPVHTKGYGLLKVDGATRLAHRLSYEMLVGPIPEGLVIDHLCRVTHCVNPDHLEAVTQRENIRRGVNPAAASMSKEHCTAGHEFTPENTYVPPKRPNRRQCKACQRSRVHAHNQRKKEMIQGG